MVNIKEEGKEHSCVRSLSKKMNETMTHKDILIQHLTQELRKRDEILVELASKQKFLERKLNK